MPGAAIFDLDGLLIDSEPLWRRAERACFARVGVALTEEDCRSTTGLRIDLVTRHWGARRPWSGPSPEELAAEIVDVVSELIAAEGEPKEGASSAILAARDAGLRCAVASSSPMKVIDAAVRRLGLAKDFAVIHSAESEPYPKPHPAVFMTTATRLGLEPSACVVLEDSLHGVIAAKAARMACIAVPEPEVAHLPAFAVADLVLASLTEVDAETFERIRSGLGP